MTAMSTLPYPDRTIALATMHGKDSAIAPAIEAATGARVVVPAGLDTDVFGTFSGEVARQGTMLEVALAKARAGMARLGTPLGLSSEGTFGPHPSLPFLPAGQELMVFVDDERGIVVSESLVTEATNFDARAVGPDEAIDAVLARLGAPEHAVIVRPNAGAGAIEKGLREAADIRAAVARAASASADGRASVETDMRAHMNPTRMASLRTLAEALAARLATPCPACAAPGFGRVDVERGLVCAECEEPTDMVAAEIFGCPACGHRERRPRRDGLRAADPGACAHCNP